MWSAELFTLASAATIRKRVTSSFSYSSSQINALADHVASLNTLAYADRLQDIVDALNLDRTITPDKLDDATFAKLVKQARATAHDIADTHDADLRAFIASQLADDPTLSQADLARLARQWENERADYKPEQIARTQGMWARHQADQDVIRANRLTSLVRFAGNDDPDDDVCREAVDAGWMTPEAASRYSPPFHPNCVHYLEYQTSIADQLDGADEIWVGDWVDTASGRAASA